MGREGECGTERRDSKTGSRRRMNTKFLLDENEGNL